MPEPVRMSLLPLLLALAIMFGLSIYPHLLIHGNGRADHLAALLLLWAMSAGFVRGVGFVPRFWLWRLLFSAPASFLALAGAIFFLPFRY